MSYNTILATAPLTTQNYHLKMIGTSIGNSLIWDNGTNVGIGNTNTSYTLDVSGSGRYNGSYAGHLLNVQNTNASYYSSTDYYDNAGTEKLIVGYGNASTGNALASKAIIYGTSGVGLNFYTNGSTTAKMVIDTSGNVGIGTSSPNGNLQFATAVNTRKIVLFEGGNNDYQFYGFGVESNKLIYSTNGTADDHVFVASASSSTRNELMRIKGNGNVLIGTTTDFSANSKLQVSGGDIRHYNNTQDAYFQHSGAMTVANGGTLTLNVANGTLVFVTDNNIGDSAIFYCTYASQTVILIADPNSHYAATDTAGRACLYKTNNNTGVAIFKNNLGASRSFTIFQMRNSD